VLALPGLEVTATIATGDEPAAVAYAPLPAPAPAAKSGTAAGKKPA
jgi:hypothetical protein